jgi:hypothetical protein
MLYDKSIEPALPRLYSQRLYNKKAAGKRQPFLCGG